MSIENAITFIEQKASDFGAKIDNEYNKPYILRKKTRSDDLKDNGAFFGLIAPEEEQSGPYHDFSFVIFPAIEESWLVCLGIGSSGFKNDYELATFPGIRRLFSKLVDENGFCKTDFSDIESSLPKSLTGRPELQHIKNTIKTYTKVLPVCQIVSNPESEEGKKVIAAFIAAYAKLRDWPTNQIHRNEISKALDPFLGDKAKEDDLQTIQSLLLERRFVVLQGPPGTGKTRAAKKVSENLSATTVFTQFHAETSFSDFIYGIRPDLKNSALSYIERSGDFTKALKQAIENPNTKTVLIIDEINRANLSNVLGPIFYLFEPKMTDSNVEIEISPDFKINKLPKNLYVIATMNTADRSLAVVDFALRRRFAWYNLKPKLIEGKTEKLDAIRLKNGEEKEFNISVIGLDDDQYFFIEDFNQFEEIFNWYATSNELSLQPGQGYFIAASDDEMKNRIKYELFPLIKEYLNEGLIKSSKEEFNNYFSTRINQSLFE